MITMNGVTTELQPIAQTPIKDGGLELPRTQIEGEGTEFVTTETERPVNDEKTTTTTATATFVSNEIPIPTDTNYKVVIGFDILPNDENPAVEILTGEIKKEEPKY